MSCYENYPTRLVAFNILEVLAAMAVGVIIIAHFGLGAAMGYAALALLAVALSIAFGCTRCHYYGRLCGTGLGRIASLIFKKRDEEEFGSSFSQIVSWTLVGIIPVLPIAAGLAALRDGIVFIQLLRLGAFLSLVAAIAVTHSKLVCNRCHQAKEKRCSLGHLGRSA